jgi:hypothetical protein
MKVFKTSSPTCLIAKESIKGVLISKTISGFEYYQNDKLISEKIG